MWLTNEGLECTDAKITYVELAQEISEFSREAESFATMKPPKQKIVVE
jgi:hypothetical protein